MPNQQEVVLGVFTHEKDTQNTHRFQRTTESGRKETQYVPKSTFEGQQRPDQIELVIRW